MPYGLFIQKASLYLLAFPMEWIGQVFFLKFIPTQVVT